jgi:phosphogluconate dehydratase
MTAVIPLLCQVYPNGKADVNEFHAEGGIARLLTNLLDADLIYENIQTVAGLGLQNYTKIPAINDSNKNNLDWREVDFELITATSIRTAKNPFKNNGGIKFIGGDIAEGVIKVSALEKENEIITGPARVFTSQEDVLNAFELNELNADLIIVLLGQSPTSNGMPELHKLTSPINVLQSKGYKIALVTDGRMSGASGSFPALIHAVSINNNLYKIQDNDQLTLDLKKAIFSIENFDSEREPIHIESNGIGLGRELFSIFRSNVGSVSNGASIFYE